MAKLEILAGSTSQSVNIFIQDSSKTTGAGLTGLVFNTSGLLAYYTFTGANTTSAVIALATLSLVTSAYSSGGFKEIDATNMPGLYRLDIPNAALAASKGSSVVVMLTGAANMAPCVLEIALTAWNNQDGVHGGLTALPNAAAGAVGGLPLSVDTSGRVDVLKINGTSQTARDIGASVLLSAGTGTGQLDFTSGVVKANLAQILGTALTETAGQIAAGFKQFFNIASPTSTMNTITTVTTATNLTNAPTSGDFTSTMKTSLNAATPVASLSGDFTTTMKTSIGTAVAASAVASVTGNIGGTLANLGSGAKTDVENAVWNATMSSHVTAGSTGATLSSAGSAGDPWSTSLPGAYASGTAGNIVGNNLNAAITSRMATYTQPTGFLAATFPTTIASPTNITAGTITTTTNLTNAPTSGDFTATMKTSLNAATPAVTVSDKTGFALTSAYDFAKGTVAMTESYSVDGVAMTPAQALYLTTQILGESSISGTTRTVKKVDGSTTAATYTLDSGTAPTSITRAS